MKAFFPLGLILFTLQAVGVAGTRTDLIVVAEQTGPGIRLTRPTPEHPVYYIAYDAGYIEAGPPIGGLKPPAPAVIGRTLRTALDSEGYRATTAETVPSLVLVYHWGYIRPGPHIRFIWEGRLDLVAPEIRAHLSEEFLVDGLMANHGLPPPDQHLHDTGEPVRDARYFVIVSAYDYADLARQKTTLLWRVKLSASENSGALDEILPALAGGGGPFFARSFDSRLSIAAQRLARTDGGTAGGPPAADPPGSADAGLIGSLMKHVRDFFVSQALDADQRHRPPLPPALAQRITAYQQEKAALQGVLTEKIKIQAPGPDIRRAIDTFNAENSPRIAALGRMGESIRGELAQLSTANSSPAADQPLDTLLREFATDVRQLERPPADTH